MTILSKLFNWYFSRKAMPYWAILLLDCAIVMFSGYVGLYLELGGDGFAGHFWPFTWGMALSLTVFLASFRIFHTYTGVVRYSSFVDLQRVALANFLACLIVLAVSLTVSATFTRPETDGMQSAILLPTLTTVATIFILSTLSMWVVRIVVKVIYDNFRIDASTRRAFIYGVRDGAVAIAKGIRNQEDRKYTLAGFISPDGYLAGQYLMGVEVLRDGPGLIERMQKDNAGAILVSPLQADRFRERDSLIDGLTAAGIRILMMPQPMEWDDHHPIGADSSAKFAETRLREVEIEDLLPRQQIQVDMTAIADTLNGQCILITGAAGSIGSEIVRQVAQFGPSQLILVDQAETPMHDIRLMMAGRFPQVKAETIVASITNAEYMERLFSEYRPQYVFHAAAYKHVPMMENNPAIAVQNNILGTRIIADLAVRYGTRKFVMISTDKAVNPTNVMGCSKRICEIYCQSLNKAIQEGKVEGSTQFVTTRFGNVLGSNGSVIPLFREQIRKGGPVTVTDPDIIRYFMLIPEACRLVLEAATLGKGGEIFVFDMGKPVRIVDLAKRMIALSGVPDVKIEFTGLRDGEKLFEEVLSDKEKTKPTVNSKIFVADVREYDYGLALDNETRLLKLSRTGDKRAIVRMMQEIVPEYRSNNQAYA